MASSEHRGGVLSALSRRGVLLGAGGALAGVTLGTLWRPSTVQATHGGDGDDVATVVRFTTMAGVSGPFVGRANPVRSIPGGGLPWKLISAEGALLANGKLEVSVRGLVLAGGPPNLIGTNPIATFKAIVSVLTSDGNGGVATVNLPTGLFPATPTGDADIEGMLTLPHPAFAPIIFVGPGPALAWFASTGA